MKLFGKREPPEAPVRRRQPRRDDSTTLQSRAFSYYAQRSDNLSNTGRREIDDTNKRHQWSSSLVTTRRQRLVLIGIIIVTLIAGIVLLPLSPSPKVVLLRDSTTAYFLQDAGVYKQAAENQLARSILNRNKLTVDTGAVRLKLLKDYPEIKDVSVRLPFLGHSPEIYIESYKPSFILTTASSNAFLLDMTGRALATTSQIPGSVHLNVPTLEDRSNIDVKLGSRALPSTTVQFTQTVVAALKARHVAIASLVLPAGAYELDVHIAGAPYFVKFNLEGDALQQSGTYLATRQRLASDHVQPTQYVDVRVPQRAYYK